MGEIRSLLRPRIFGRSNNCPLPHLQVLRQRLFRKTKLQTPEEGMTILELIDRHPFLTLAVVFLLVILIHDTIVDVVKAKNKKKGGDKT